MQESQKDVSEISFTFPGNLDCIVNFPPLSSRIISGGLVIHKQEKINAKNQRRYVVVMSPLSGSLSTTTASSTKATGLDGKNNFARASRF